MRTFEIQCYTAVCRLLTAYYAFAGSSILVVLACDARFLRLRSRAAQSRSFNIRGIRHLPCTLDSQRHFALGLLRTRQHISSMVGEHIFYHLALDAVRADNLRLGFS
jgi:hypothetical protein